MAWRAIQSTVGTSESLSSLTHLGERIYWRLLAHSDPWGRLDGRPRKLRALCYPMLPNVTDAEVGNALFMLTIVDRIQVYGTPTQPYIEIMDFEKHQPREAFRKRPPESVFPAPPADSGNVPELLRNYSGTIGEKPSDAGVSGNAPEGVRNGSGSVPDETRREGEETRPTTTGASTLAAVGWTMKQQRQAAKEPARAMAWVKYAKAQPDTRSVGALSWSGFDGGGWPETEPADISRTTVHYDHACPHCPVECKTERLLEEHIHVMHPAVEVVPPPSEFGKAPVQEEVPA